MTPYPRSMQVFGLLLLVQLAGCSAVQPSGGVPPPTEGLQYPSIGSPLPAGSPTLTPQERSKLESDLNQYRVAPQ